MGLLPVIANTLARQQAEHEARMAQQFRSQQQGLTPPFLGSLGTGLGQGFFGAGLGQAIAAQQPARPQNPFDQLAFHAVGGSVKVPSDEPTSDDVDDAVYKVTNGFFWCAACAYVLLSVLGVV